MSIRSKPPSKEYTEGWDRIFTQKEFQLSLKPHFVGQKVYLAGPMRGIPDFNFPAFFAAEEKLKAAGYEVFNPARRDVEKYGIEVYASSNGKLEEINPNIQFSLREALEADSIFICRHAEAIALLPGWETSKGATAEKRLAEALNLEVIYL